MLSKILQKKYDIANNYILENDDIIRNFVIKYSIPRYYPTKISLITPFQGFVEAIISQQLTAKAAYAIYNKILKFYGSKNSNIGVIRPLDIIRVPDEELKLLGLSTNKIKAIKEIANLFINNKNLTFTRLKALDEKRLIELFTNVKGVGKWTVQMFMIFYLHKIDILATSDYGIRKGAYFLYSLPKLPKPSELEKIGEKWKPYRTVASWYLWRANEVYSTLKKRD